MKSATVQLTFPCPACGHHLTLHTFSAHGPCPTCETVLDVALTVSAAGASNTAPQAPAPEQGGVLRKFDERRFRPVYRPPEPPSAQ